MLRRNVSLCCGIAALLVGTSAALAGGVETVSTQNSLPSQSGHADLESAWQKYYSVIKKGHDATLRSEQFRLFDQQRSRGYYALLEAQAMAYNFAMVPQLASPRIYRATSWQTELYTLGGNSADFQYGTLFLDGKLEYKLTVRMNDSKVVLADWAGALPGSQAYTPPKSYDLSQFQVGPDGNVEIVLSSQKVKGNWIKLDPNAKFQWIIFRSMIGRWTDKPAKLEIERTSSLDLDAYRKNETSSAAVAERLTFAANYLNFLVDQWNIDYYQRIRANAGNADNVFATLVTEAAGDVGSPSAQYMQGVFVLDKDEALIVEMDGPPAGAFWSVQLFDSWLKSIDFRTRQSSLSMDQAVRDPDGKYRFVISAKDPGYANWLDTAGLNQGMMLVRNYRSSKLAPMPAVYRVKEMNIARYMKGSLKVTPAQRKEEMKRREAAHIYRIGES